MREAWSLSESTGRVLADLGFEPFHVWGPQVPSWHATREGRGLAAVIFNATASAPTLSLITGGDNPIDGHLVVDARDSKYRLPVGTGSERPRATHLTGDPDFDGRFEVFSLSNARDVVSVMLDDDVRRALLALPARVSPDLGGHIVTVQVPLGDPQEEAALIEGVVPTLWRLGLALDDATRRLPLPARLRPFFDAFERAATERGMTLRHNALNARKVDRGVEIRVTWHSAKCDAGRVAPHLHPEGIEIWVAGTALPGRPEMRSMSGATDLLRTFLKGGAGTGDGAFDRAWSFEADDPAAARRWLSPEVRAALTALRAAGLKVEVKGAGLLAKGPLPRSDALVPSLLPLLETLAQSMIVASTPFRGR